MQSATFLDHDPHRAPAPVPRVRLFREPLLIQGQASCEEITASVLSLELDGPPDREAELRACRILESLGAIEIDCLDDCEPMPGSRADYVIHLDGDVHHLCAFSAYAMPELRAQGFEVEVDEDYPFKTVPAEAPWYAELSSDDDGWFGLELGVEVDGERASLLPALLDLLEQTRDLASLKRTGRRCVALPFGDGRYVAVPPERLRLLLEVLLELYGGQGSSEAIPMARASALARLGLAFSDEPEQLRWRGKTEVRDVGYEMAIGPAPPSEDAEEPELLQATLRPYQREGLAWLQHLRSMNAGGVLADDMGLGKTLQTIAHVAAEKAAGRLTEPALVIAPTSLVEGWRREFAKFAPSLRVHLSSGPKRRKRFAEIPEADVVVTSYPLLVRDREHLEEQEFSIVVLDEAHLIKNRRSQSHRAACALRARHRVCLTGTPIENHLGEMWSLFHFLMPGFLGSAEGFDAWFRAPIEQRGDGERLRILRETVGPYILRRTKERVASDLPPKTEIVRAVELEGAQRDLYEGIRVAAHARVRTAIASRGLGQSTMTVLEALLKLRQVCCDPRLARVDAARAIEQSSKLDLLEEMVTRQVSQGRRILIFSQFANMLELIGERLQAAGVRFTTLTGATRDRQKRVDAFQDGEVDVFLISLKAGGCGLNLTAADTVIHYDPWWNPAAQAQASDRAHRIGQDKPVFVYNLIVAGSVEERMLALQRHKRRLAGAVLDQAGAKLSERDVEDLFAPLG